MVLLHNMHGCEILMQVFVWQALLGWEEWPGYCRVIKWILTSSPLTCMPRMDQNNTLVDSRQNFLLTHAMA